jgi:alpha-L-fucosidase
MSLGAYRGGAGRTEDPAKQEEYNEILRKQWEEVLSGYGKIYEIWFDGSCIVPLDDIIQKYASDAIIFQSTMANIRWVGNERGYAPYPAWNSVKKEDALTGVATAADGDPDGDAWMPLEVDIPLKTHSWVWAPGNEKLLKSLDDLVEIYYKSVGRGTVLLINAAPDTTGMIPEADMELYRKFGEDLRNRFGNPIAETAGKGDIVELELGGMQEIDHVITMEDIAFGERVRAYIIEGSTGDEWFEIVRGISIGHKRIDRFETVKATKIRFRSLKSAAPPVLRKLAAFYVNDPKVYDKLESTKDDFGTPWTRGESRKYESPVKIGKLEKFKQTDDYRIDLSKYIDEPGQYEVYIAASAKSLPKLPGTADIFLDGNNTPGRCKINELKYRIEINITAYPTMNEGSILIRFTLSDMARNDNVYIRKVVFD